MYRGYMPGDAKIWQASLSRGQWLFQGTFDPCSRALVGTWATQAVDQTSVFCKWEFSKIKGPSHIDPN